MGPELILEMIGYVSSVLILISLLMTSVVKFRVINAVGSLIFTVYAILIASYPTAGLNFCLVLIDLWFLWKVLRKKTMFCAYRVERDDSAAAHFLDFYREDIRTFFPEFQQDIREADYGYLVYADANPVGLLVGKRLENDGLEVLVDYSCPSHRDCSVGTFLYGHLAQAGIRRLVTKTVERKHARYLRRMGFACKGQAFIKEL